MKKRKWNTFFFKAMILAVMIGAGHETVQAEELTFHSLFSQLGEWYSVDAMGEEGTEVTYVVEFFPDESMTQGELFFSYAEQAQYWLGNYYSAGPAEVSYGEEYAGCWLYNYYFDTPDGERNGEIAVKTDGETLTITEMAGDAFWPFTSRSTETLEFVPVQILDGDGYCAGDYAEDSYEDISYFQVVNCQEWVSLRSEPDVNSFRITEVPLDTVVLDCNEYVNRFHFVSFAGVYGYIHGDFLMRYEEEENVTEEYLQPASTIPMLMTYEEITSFGYEVLNYQKNEFTVYASREYAEGETLKVGAFRNGEPMWGYISSCPYDTELQITDAFVAGTAQDPKIVIFNAESSMMLVDMFFGDMEWELGMEELGVGGTLCYDVADDGTIYCAGYYDLGPTAISMSGEVLWSAQPKDPNTYWPYEIEAEEPYVIVEYATGNEDGNDVVAYGLDGTWQWADIKSYY